MSTLCFSFPCVAQLWAFVINECSSFESLCASAPIKSVTGGGKRCFTLNPIYLLIRGSVHSEVCCAKSYGGYYLPFMLGGTQVRRDSIA